MSDAPLGPGWWQASDGKYYAPEQAPGYQPPPVPPVVGPSQPPPQAQPAGPVQPPWGPPGQPPAPPGAVPPGPLTAPWPGQPGQVAQPPWGQPGQPGPYGQPVYAGGPPSGRPASVGNALSWASNKIKANLGTFVLLTLGMFVAFIAIEVISTFLPGSSGVSFEVSADGTTTTSQGGGAGGVLAMFALLAVGVCVSVYGNFVLMRAALAALRGEPVSIGDACKFDRFAPFLGAAIVAGIGTMVGMIACIIPGIVFIFFAYLYGWFVLDKQMGPLQAIRASFKLVGANAGTCFVMALAAIGLTMLGLILCGVGLLYMVPLVVLATGYLYRTMSGEPVAP